MEKHWSLERKSPTWTINEKLLTPENKDEVFAYAKARQEEYEAMQAKAEKDKKDAELRKYPSIRTLFDRMKLQNVPQVKAAVLKRFHIILEYLKTPALPDGMEPTMEYALSLLGRAEVSLSLIEEMAKILQDYSGYTYIRTYPREAIQLREHIRTQRKLAEDLVRAIAFNKVKEEGIYEPKTETNKGEPVLP